MTDFYALLKQSIIERDIRDANDREAVYAQARQAIIKQLWAFRPPLAANEIDTRVGAYDSAVEQIEKDLKAEFARDSAKRRAEAAPSPQPRRRPEPPPPPPPDPEPLTELEAVREADDDEDDDEIAAPPLAEWRHEEGDDVLPVDVEDEAYERGVPRAGTDTAFRRWAPADPEAEDDRTEASGYSDDQDGARRTGEHERWRDDGKIVARTNWWLSFSDRDKIQILAGAIAALAIALVALVAYLYFSRDTVGGVTLDIGVRREVSDAATASKIAAETLEVTASYSVFDGRDPTIFATTPNNPVRFVSEGGYARVSSSASAPGAKVHIGPGLAARLAGKPVRVTIVARASEESGAASMRFAYQSGVAISHWQTANLSPQYEAVAMIWRLPAMRTDPDGDYIVIEPGIPGDGTGVDIQSIKIDVLAGEQS
jgi:hypothetical protein